jgi:hypothetical protein
VVQVVPNSAEPDETDFRQLAIVPMRTDARLRRDQINRLASKYSIMTPPPAAALAHRETTTDGGSSGQTSELVEYLGRHDIIPPADLGQPFQQGHLVRVGHTQNDSPASWATTVTRVPSTAPKAIVCLLSALNFHQIGT